MKMTFEKGPVLTGKLKCSQLKAGQIGKVNPSLYVIKSQDDTVVRVWVSGEVEPMNFPGKDGSNLRECDWEVEVMPDGSSIKLTS